MLDALWIDTRQAVRRIARSAWMSLIVVLTLSFAFAANATVLSLIKPTVLAKLSSRDPAALLSIAAIDARTANYSAIHVTVLSALQAQQHSFTTLAAFVSSIVRVESGGTTEDVGVEGVTPDYFAVLDVRPKSGRMLSRTDDALAPIAVISDRLATRLFADGRPIDRTIVVEGRPVTVIGVTETTFIGTRMDGGDDVFLPLAYLRFIQGGNVQDVPRAQLIVGRLAPGVTAAAARAETLGRWPSIQAAVAEQLPAAQQPVIHEQRIVVDSFSRGFSGTRDRYGRSLELVMGLAVALLGVACVNLSGLMLARSLARRHEFAVRIALGGSRLRLLQQVLIDGVLLSVAALVIAIPLSYWLSTVLTSKVSVARAMPLGRTTPDLEILLVTAAGALATGVAIGALAARRVSTRNVGDVLRGRGIAQRIRGSARAILIAQVSLSMVFVVSAGLFFASLSNLYANDLQHREHPILFTRLARNPLDRSRVLPLQYFQDLQNKLASIPGADRAAFSVFYPAYLGFFNTMPTDTVTLEGRAQAAAVNDSVTPGFFELYSITQLRGRDFTWSDSERAPPVAIANEMLARKLAGSADGIIGHHVRVSAGQTTTDVEIVGVVADATVSSIREQHVAGLYRPMMQDLRRGQNPMAHVRVVGDTNAVQRVYVDVVNAQGQHFVRGMFTMEGWVANAVVEQQLIAGMAGVAAVLTLALSGIGLFGLLAYSVSSRIREIGVRMSVGATATEIMSMIVREGLIVMVPGVAAGILLSLAVAAVLRSQLYGVSAADPVIVAAAAVIFIAVAGFASWLPARFAARVQPIDALRQQ